MTKPQKPWACQKCGAKGHTISREHPRSRICAWCAKELAANGLQWCGGCKTGKVPTDFTSRYVCRACNSARAKAWRADHPEYTKEHNDAYREAHRDEMIAYRRTYYQANRGRLLAKKKDYYRDNAERLIEDQRRRRRDGLISEASKLKARQRHRMKHKIYKQNEKIARARRFLQSIRGGTGETSRHDPSKTKD